MISEFRQVTTRKGDRMAILQLEDLTGSCEAVVFPKSYARLSDHLMAEARLLIWAGVDRRDERVQLIVDDCRAVDDLKLLVVELPVDQASDSSVQHKLRECLQQHRPDREELGESSGGGRGAPRALGPIRPPRPPVLCAGCCFSSGITAGHGLLCLMQRSLGCGLIGLSPSASRADRLTHPLQIGAQVLEAQK